jgi:hypothetical protein
LLPVIGRRFFCAGLVLFSSCTWFEKKESPENKEAVARVYNRYLFRSDIAGLVPAGASASDSASIVNNYINSWIRQNIVLHKAEEYLSANVISGEIEKKIADYRNSLITYLYEKELISQKLDTLVSDREIEEYYNNNQGNFELKDNIVKVLYLRLGKDAPKLNKVREWYKSDNPKDRTLLEDYCHQYALNFYLDDETWLQFDDLIKEIPIKTYDKEQFLKNNRFIEVADSSGYYFVNIKGFRIKDSLSPLSFEKENIRNLIINRRKVKLIEETEKKAYEEAVKNNGFEIYNYE